MHRSGAIAQLGERLLCKQEVGGATPPGSTKIVDVVSDWFRCSISLFNKLDIESDKGADRSCERSVIG